MRTEHLRQRRNRRRLGLVLAGGLLVSFPGMLHAQTGGEGGLQGTITDPTGAAVGEVTVTLTNQATGVAQTKTSTGSGVYTFAPIPPGVYTVDAKREGFEEFIQKNLRVDAVNMTGFDVKLTAGGVNQVVEVTDTPPQLQTENATLGMTIENEAYTNLPLVMNNAQRDATAFGSLAPGAQGGARLPIVGGTGNYLGQLYLDGLPAQTVSQQGDNRLVSLAVSVDAIDQLQVLTSTPPVEYSGAGAENFTVKSGGLKYHGQVSDYVRNTIFDAWPFTTKAQTVPNGKGGQVPASKPVDHQNELSASAGGHVPFTDRVFFFVAYDRYHQRRSINPATYTVPTVLEKQGDFTELNGNVGAGGFTGVPGDPSAGGKNPALLFDPTTTNCSSNGVCTRQPFMGLKNGIPTYNVIPANYISPIAQAMQKNLPDPTNPSSLTSNYAGSQPAGFDNYSIDYRMDFQITPKHRLSTVGAMGKVGYLNNFGAPYLPLPYTGGDYATIYPKVFDVQDVLQIRDNLVNQLKFGYTRFFQDIVNATQGVSGYQLGDLGVTNLPQGQAGQEFPGVSFGANGANAAAMTTWTTNSNATSTQVTTPNNFTLLDNLLWTKGRHSVTAGIQVQWQEINNANPATYTGILQLSFNSLSTAAFGSNSSALLQNGSGYSYASFLLGAVGGSPSLGLQPVSEVGGRYRPIAPYIEDTWKVTDKLTIDAGLRWDYLPPYHEVKDRWSFLNPNIANPATGTPGAIQFAGNYGGAGVSCGCRTPVQTYWNNWGPRIGVTYQVDDKTVFRAGVGRVFSQGGGVGGRGGSFNGTGQLGFNTTAVGNPEVTSGQNAGPSFYLNNSTGFTKANLANTSLFGAGFTYPTPPPPSPASQALNAGNYLVNGKNVAASSVSYADPYFSGRAPDFMFYNAGFQRALTKAMTLAINYVGNQSHHLINSTSSGSNPRGFWSNQLDPRYLAALGPLKNAAGTAPLLSSPATPANVAIAAAAVPGISIPQFFQADAAVNSNATIAQGLVAFPQYSSVTDLWGANVGNFSYNSLQVTVEQRMAHGLTFNFNYTWSKNLGDDGTFRSGYAIPAAALSGGGHDWKMDRIERSVATISTPHVFHAYGTYMLPFGKGDLGGNHLATRQLLGGWQLSAIWTYYSGTPVALTSQTCGTGPASNYPLEGQCMPDLAPGVTPGQARINGGYGRDASGHRTACALGFSGCKAVQYISPTAFKSANTFNSSFGANSIQMIGNAPRTAAYGLTNPAQLTLDAALRRTFPIHESVNVQIEVTAQNLLNHSLFGSPNAVYGNSAFGTITGMASSYSPRAFQLAGHFNF